jgi:hypothetical protein
LNGNALGILPVEPANFQQAETIVPSGAWATSGLGGIAEMQICVDEEGSWESHSSGPYEAESDAAPEWSDEVDAQPSAHSEADEDSEAFLSPDWD